MQLSNPSYPGLPDGIISTLQDAIYDQVTDITPIGNPARRAKVVDHTYKFTVTANSGNQFVLIISNPNFPFMVSSAVAKLQSSRSALRLNSSTVIEEPTCHGFLGKTSFALWKRRNTLSSNRYYKFIQKRLLAIKVARWLRTVANETRRSELSMEDLQSGFIHPLQLLCSNIKLSDKIRNAGKLVLQRLLKNEFTPVHTLQHGDLWIGNLLLTNFTDLIHPTKQGFFVIDWAGSKLNGYPFVDLANLLRSCNISPKASVGFFQKMASRINCKPSDVPFYMLCFIGKMGQELDNFPENRFIRSCEEVWSYISKVQTHCS